MDDQLFYITRYGIKVQVAMEKGKLQEALEQVRNMVEAAKEWEDRIYETILEEQDIAREVEEGYYIDSLSKERIPQEP